ncbi:sulfotransferase family protein [Candidatus Binatus soli]|uniref:sulfotransferase family protein n=1 Tax=Candidatus Binatus soli TaxID=1953413 RepID=UPI003D09E0E6
MRLPDFIAVGPPRTATTWLHEVLKGHVGLPLDIKETDFFSKHYDKGIDWYADYFRHCPPAIKIGELCATYFASPEARERIARHLPECRIICTLRDPVDRSYSFYRLLRRHAWTKLPFEEAAAKHREIREQNRYAFHLAGWQRQFGADHVLVGLYDDFEADAQAFVDRVTAFVGIDRIVIPPGRAFERVHPIETAPPSRRLVRATRQIITWMHSRRMHRAAIRFRKSALGRFVYEGGRPYGPLAPDVEARVRELYRPEVEALEELLAIDLSAWKKPRDPQAGHSDKRKAAMSVARATSLDDLRDPIFK